MLLNHLNIGQLVLLASLFYHVVSQVFNTGIISLTSNTTNSSYTLTNITSSKDVILTISSFTSIQKITVCSIEKRQDYSINFVCTDNILSVGYLFYQKTPLIYSNYFNYYFLPNDSSTNVTWLAPINLTIIHYPTLRAMLSGFSLRDTNYASIQLLTLLNNTGITISRTVNVKKISFSFLIIQSYGAYNLSFDQMLFSKYTKMAFQSQLSNVLNFWGFFSFKFQKITSQDQLFFTANSKGRNSNSVIMFDSSQNLLLSLIFFISNQNTTRQSCSNYFSPTLKTCESTCNVSNTITWNTSQFKFNFCFESKITNYSNLTYLNNNSKQLLTLYSQRTGCSQPYFNQDGDIVCKSCTGDFIDYQGLCVCKYGFMKELFNCRKCENNECSLKKQISYKVKDIDLAQINIIVSVYLDKSQIQESSPKDYKQILVLNGQIHQVYITYDPSSVSLNFEIKNITKQNKYQIRIQDGDSTDQNSFFYIRKTRQNQTLEYLWSLTLNLTIKSNLSSQAVLQTTISSLVQNSDKTVPVIFAIGFLIGDKINLMSFFQTISIVYLTKFIEMDEQYDVLKDLISKLFVFHPKALWNFGNVDQLLKGFAFENQIRYNKSIYMLTQGNMLIKTGLNELLSLILQIIGISLIFFLAKKLLKPSTNKISPAYLENQINQNVKNSSKQKSNKIQTKEYQKQSSTNKQDFRTRLYTLVSSFDQKKYVHFTSLILTYNLYFVLLSLYEITLPLFSLQAIISRVFTSLLLLVILLYPIFLINYKSLYVLKSTSILKKRYLYTRNQIWFYFYLYYNQSTIYGIILVLLNNSIVKVSMILLFQLTKLMYFRIMLKNIEVLKIIAILLFYTSLLLDLTLPLNYSNLLSQITILTILLIIFCQLLKLIRGLIILTLNLFKSQCNIQKQKQKPKDKEKNSTKNIQKVVIIQKLEIVKEEDINPVFTHITERCQNSNLTKRYNRRTKRNQFADQNKQIQSQREQSKKKEALRRFNEICVRRRDLLKVQN